MPASYGRSVLNCPQCGATAADGTAICPSCDYILDTSFLSADPPELDEVPASPQPRPRPSGNRPRSGARPARPRPSSGARAQVRPAAPVSHDATQIKSVEDLEAERPPPRRPASGARRPARRPPRPAAAAPAAEPEDEAPPAREPVRPAPSYPTSDVLRSAPGSGVVSPEDMLADAKNFVVELPLSDKLAFLASVVTVLTAFLPWKETATDGDILGLMSLGLLGVLAGLVAAIAVSIRVRRSMPRLNPVVPWLAQLGAVSFGLLWCLVFIKLSYNGQQVHAMFGSETVSISSPSSGVFIALLSNIVALAGTLMGLREKAP